MIYITNHKKKPHTEELVLQQIQEKIQSFNFSSLMTAELFFFPLVEITTNIQWEEFSCV